MDVILTTIVPQKTIFGRYTVKTLSIIIIFNSKDFVPVYLVLLKGRPLWFCKDNIMLLNFQVFPKENELLNNK